MGDLHLGKLGEQLLAGDAAHVGDARRGAGDEAALERVGVIGTAANVSDVTTLCRGNFGQDGITVPAADDTWFAMAVRCDSGFEAPESGSWR